MDSDMHHHLRDQMRIANLFDPFLSSSSQLFTLLRSRGLRSRLPQTQLEATPTPQWGLRRNHSRQWFWCILRTWKRYWWHLKCALLYTRFVLRFPFLATGESATRVTTSFLLLKMFIHQTYTFSILLFLPRFFILTAVDQSLPLLPLQLIDVRHILPPQLAKFLYNSCRKKITAPPSAGARGICAVLPPLSAATVPVAMARGVWEEYAPGVENYPQTRPKLAP